MGFVALEVVWVLWFEVLVVSVWVFWSFDIVVVVDGVLDKLVMPFSVVSFCSMNCTFFDVYVVFSVSDLGSDLVHGMVGAWRFCV